MTVLKGPADADHFRVKVGRYGDRWYTDPTPTCEVAEASDWQGPSFSIVKKASGSDWSHVSLGRGATDIAARPDKYASGDRAEVYDLLTSANKRGLKDAAGRGTIVHWWFEDGLADRDFRTVTEFDLAVHELSHGALRLAELYRPAVQQFFDTYQPKLYAAETVCIHRDLNGVGYGATADAEILIEGQRARADWKTRTSDHDCYWEEPCQVAAADGAQYHIAEGADGTPVRVKPTPADLGLIVSIMPDGCRLYPIDLALGWQQFERLHAWWVARRDERKPIGRAWPPKVKASAPDPALPNAALLAALADALEAAEPTCCDLSQGECGCLDKETLLTRFHALDPESQFKFRARNIAKDDLPAIKAALDEFTFETVISIPRVVGKVWPGAARTAKPDEGADILSDDFSVFKARYDKLPPDAQRWMMSLIDQADAASVPFRGKAKPTKRRFELYRGLINLCTWMNEQANDEVLGALVYAASGSDDATLFANVTPGHALGSLGYEEAALFARLVDDLIVGRLRPAVDPDGALRLEAA